MRDVAPRGRGDQKSKIPDRALVRVDSTGHLVHLAFRIASDGCKIPAQTDIKTAAGGNSPIAAKNGLKLVADSLIRWSDRSLCAPDPRRSTSPGFGVSSASAISACSARAASAWFRRAQSGGRRVSFSSIGIMCTYQLLNRLGAL